MEKRTHWNKETKSLMEGEGQARSLGISRPNRQCAHNHRYSKVAHLSHLAKQPAEEAKRRQGTAKYSDKPGKSAVTSH